MKGFFFFFLRKSKIAKYFEGCKEYLNSIFLCNDVMNSLSNDVMKFYF